MTWPFDDPPNVAVFTTKSIAFGRQPVLLVTHNEEDGAWQFLPREGARHVKDTALVSLREMIEQDGTLAELADLPIGWRAWRESPASSWLRKWSTDASSDKWPSTSVRCAAAIFPESEVDRTRSRASRKRRS